MSANFFFEPFMTAGTVNGARESYSLFPVRRGEGRGEGRGARGVADRPIEGPASIGEASAVRLGTSLAPLPCPLPRSTVGEGEDRPARWRCIRESTVDFICVC